MLGQPGQRVQIRCDCWCTCVPAQCGGRGWCSGVTTECGVTVDTQVYQHTMVWLLIRRCTSTLWCDCWYAGVPAHCGVSVDMQVYQHSVVWQLISRCTSTMCVTVFYVQVYQHSVAWLCFVYRCTCTLWCDCVLSTGVPAQCGVTVLCTGVPAQCLRQGLSVPLLQESPDGDGSGLQHYGAGVLHVHFQRLHGRVSQHAWQSPDIERVLHVRVGHYVWQESW